MTIKIRPSVLSISVELIAALIIALKVGEREIATSIVITLAAISSKLVESEEKGN